MKKKYYYQHDETGRTCSVDHPLPFGKYTPITSVQYFEFLPDGVPCDHLGCLSHMSHPCEICGRIGGKRLTPLAVDFAYICACGKPAVVDGIHCDDCWLKSQSH